MLEISGPMNRLVRSAALAFGLAASAAMLSSPAGAQDLPTLQQPVMVTSMGQSLDAFSIQLQVRRAGITFKYDNHFEPSDFGDTKTLFLAVGASVKGFGEAGISIEDELARAHHFLDEAKKDGIKVVALHMGGQDRRDDLSNQLIQVIAPQSDLLIVVPASDEDGIFTKISKDNNIPLVKVDSALQLPDLFKKLFGTSSS